MIEAGVEAHLSEARAARRRGEGRDVLAAVEAAWTEAGQLPDDHPLWVAVAWKRAKAHHDFGNVAGIAPCLTPILEREDLFTAYPHGVFGVDRACRAHQDLLGYGHPTIRRLWQRLAEHHDATGDRYQALQAHLQLAWDAACRGADIVAALAPINQARPSDLEGGPSWHPQANDAPGSLPWLFLDAAHTHLRAGVWSGDATEAREAAEELEHTVSELASPPRPYVQHALLEAAFYGFCDVPEPLQASGDGFDARFIRALQGGEGFVDAAEVAPGPEWRLAAQMCAVRLGRLEGGPVTESARELGCLAFVQAATRSSRTRE